MTSSSSIQNELPPSGDTEKIWVYIKAGLDRILHNPGDNLGNNAYINLYTAVYNYCTSLKSSMGNAYYTANDATHNLQGTAFGKQLYERLNANIAEYMAEVVSRSHAHTGDDLLSFYNQEWTKYGDSAKITHNIFSYLNRHWIQREQEEGANVCDVSTLMYQLWRDQFFMQVRNTLLESVFSLMTRIRDGQVADINLVKSVADSFISLGNDDTVGASKKMEFYDKVFLQPLIQASSEYYRIESERLLQEGTTIDYIIRISARLKEEDDRAELFLHESSLKEFKDALNTVLITRQKERFCAEFTPLLDARDKDNLKRLYSLMSRTGTGAPLDPLRLMFSEYVKNAGLEAVRQVSGTEEAGGSITNEARLFVTAILSVHDQFAELLHDAFDEDTGFSKSLDNACKEFFNVNQMCPEGGARAPQLLAHYCDTLLKKGSANVRVMGAEGASDEDNLEAQLSQAVSVYRFLKAADVFQKFYSQHLARRLVYDQSVSSHGEEVMISKLKDVSGVDFTSKLQRMFLDMTVGKEMSEEFKEKTMEQDYKLPFDFDMKVLHTVSWPLKSQDSNLVLPPQMASVCDHFTTYYQNKHNGRKLNWLWQYSRAEIKMFFPKATGAAAKSGYIFSVTTFQLAILMMFNAESGPGTGYDTITGPTLTMSQIVQETGLEESAVKGELEVFCKAQIMKSSNGKVNGDSKFVLNADFKSKRMRLNLSAAKKSEQKKDAEDTMNSVMTDRMLTIQAAIVRIMKTRKTLSHRQLVEDTISQIKLFQAAVGDIKKAIDVLIDKEYLKRSDENHNVYDYLA
ncbi:ubiquitin ligase (cullin) of SCF [Coemansia sp. RSA 2703]|nr:ubiquitin ligase (cullin) of SCF [Coemansia sp. RSA 2703]KAJ2397857.1 ubiquitin ligase (cullin) of SCF [Coemansia sp. RSA 2603]